MHQINAEIKVLLVDDSNFMRLVIADIINAYPNIKVIGTASNGKEAFEKTVLLKPDVVLLDLTMADFDGIYAIKAIMKSNPLPIVVLSSIRSSNPDAVLEALKEGAFDFLDKPTGAVGSNIRQIGDAICNKIIDASKVNTKNLLKQKIKSNQNYHTFDSNLNYKIIVIGASTGGTGALESIIMKLPENLPIPVVIAQHMPHEFLISFSQRLNNLSTLTIKIAELNEEPKNGIIYVLPGNTNTILKKNSEFSKLRFESTNQTFEEYNWPSIDGFMLSVAGIFKNHSLAIILTGMGKDGTLGMTEIFKNGGLTIAQDEKSCIVYGMPKAAVQAGVISQTVILSDISAFIVSAIS